LYGAQIYSPAIAQAIRRTHARSPLDQLCLSPQCGGFASTAEGNLLTVDDQIAKLRLVVETAREVWG
jgi:5-methyltetrahydropteroyltriglutamate--homocysteine methyltransferase